MGEPFFFANAKQNLGKGFGDVQAGILENSTARLTQTVVRTDRCQVLTVTMKRPLRILFAEDNELLGDVMLCLLANIGHWVEHVDDGLRAWDRISQDLSDFDVVVTDHQMPGLKGLELVELLQQANYPGRNIVHSSCLSSDEIETYRRFGVRSIVLKGSRAEDS